MTMFLWYKTALVVVKCEFLNSPFKLFQCLVDSNVAFLSYAWFTRCFILLQNSLPGISTCPHQLNKFGDCILPNIFKCEWIFSTETFVPNQHQHDRFLLVLISQISGRKMGDGGEWSCGSQNEPLNWKHLQYTILNQNNNALWYSVISSCALRTCTHTITLGSQPHHAHSQLANSMPLVSIPHYCSLLNQAGESPCCSRIFSLFLLLSSC